MTDPRLLLATTNAGKIREIRRSLKGLGLAVVGLDKAQPGLAPRERGKTFSANARSKALYYSRTWGGLTLAEDSGLEVEALGGAPGVRSARFSAPRPSDEKNNRKVLALLGDRPASGRRARFVCVIALARRGRLLGEFRGQVRGRIGFAPRGVNGFGYDPLFYYGPFRRTFAELSLAEKSSVSHRGRALRKLRSFLHKNKRFLSRDWGSPP